MVNFKKLMFDKGLNQNDLAQIWGVSQSLVSKVIRGERNVPERYISALVEKFGPDVINKYTAADVEVEVAHPTGDTDNISEIISIPFVDKIMATAPNLSIRDLVEEKAHTLEEFPFYKMVQGVDYIQTVITMAMAPRYLPGDYLFIRFRNGQVLSGKIYLVDTRQYGTMLRYVYIEGDSYRLKALNPEFKDVYVNSEDVYSISSVVLSVNTNTSLSPEINLAEMVKRRDEEVQTVTSTLHASVNNVAELITELRKQNERLATERERTDKERERNDAYRDRLDALTK